MDEPRYTREEWERIQAEEFSAKRRRLYGEGGVAASLVVTGEDALKLSREALLELIDHKLQMLKESVLDHIDRQVK